jgi:hypothetical protein
MWFAAMSSPHQHAWFPVFMARLLAGDRDTLSLLESNPFPERPPRLIRALSYEYRFTTPEERRATGRWWDRVLVGVYFGPVGLK